MRILLIHFSWTDVAKDCDSTLPWSPVSSVSSLYNQRSVIYLFNQSKSSALSPAAQTRKSWQLKINLTEWQTHRPQWCSTIVCRVCVCARWTNNDILTEAWGALSCECKWLHYHLTWLLLVVIVGWICFCYQTVSIRHLHTQHTISSTTFSPKHHTLASRGGRTGVW